MTVPSVGVISRVRDDPVPPSELAFVAFCLDDRKDLSVCERISYTVMRAIPQLNI